jgi:ABC-2 type transport system ATP-binding protein
MFVLEVENLEKAVHRGLFQKDRAILKNVTFQLPYGETSGFVGSNGSGKTTTIKCILQFIKANRGNVKFFGQPLSSEIKNKIGYLPERPYLYEFLTGLEFLRLHWNLCYGFSQGDFYERSIDSLKKVDLMAAKDQRLRTYSKGMLQRIGLAQAILTRPDFLILDEPMSGLDPDGRIMVKEILRGEHQRGVSIFFSSHLLQDMEELCSHLVVINGGRIIFDGEIKQFISQFESLEKAFSYHKHGVQHG